MVSIGLHGIFHGIIYILQEYSSSIEGTRIVPDGIFSSMTASDDIIQDDSMTVAGSDGPDLGCSAAAAGEYSQRPPAQVLITFGWHTGHAMVR